MWLIDAQLTVMIRQQLYQFLLCSDIWCHLCWWTALLSALYL